MKNHWLDQKTDKEIDAAFEEIANEKAEMTEAEFKDSDFIDLSSDTNLYEKGEPEKVDVGQFDLKLAKSLVDSHATDVVWLSDLLCHIATIGMAKKQDTMTSTVSGDLTSTITVHTGIPENLNISTDYVTVGGDGIILGDVNIGGC